MNIVVVDDEREIADVIELYLQNDQYTVYKFYTGQEALDCIFEKKIDLAILDVMLPDIDGFQILKKIREKWSTWTRSRALRWGRTTTSPSPSTRWNW